MKSVKSVFGSVAVLSIQSQFLISEFRLNIYKVENLLNPRNLRANSVQWQKILNKKSVSLKNKTDFEFYSSWEVAALNLKLFTKTKTKKITATNHNL